MKSFFPHPLHCAWCSTRQRKYRFIGYSKISAQVRHRVTTKTCQGSGTSEVFMSFFQQRLFKNRFSFFSCYLKRSSQIKIGIKIAQGFLSSEAATEGVFLKKLFMKISQCSQENTCVESLFNKVYCNFIKKRLQVFSCEYCKIFRKTVLNNICERLLLGVFYWFSF